MLTDYIIENIPASNSSTIKTQSGQAGAVPLPDTAPLTGGAKAADIGKQPSLEYVNDWDATNFNQSANGTLSDLANSNMSERHGTNGNSYDNRKR